jgi:TIGR02391 family protein
MDKALSEQQIKSICDVLAHTTNGLTKTELTHNLQQSRIEVLDDGSSNNGYGYRIGLNKRDWLYNCMVEEINTSKSFSKVFVFIENALNPISYTTEEKRNKYSYLFEESNKVLLLIGLEVQKDGKIKTVVKAQSLDEVDRRVNSLKQKLYQRAIHSEVTKYCIKDYLRKDYYDAIFEASKGLAERVRIITGLTTDGSNLFQTAFSRSDPYIFFNSLKTESELSEHTGLRELLEAVFHLVRNPVAHIPKVNWHIDETKALDILTVISFAHKYLDECHKVPKS